LTSPGGRPSFRFDDVAVATAGARGVSDNEVADLALVLAAAELTGSARWCLETATD